MLVFGATATTGQAKLYFFVPPVAGDELSVLDELTVNDLFDKVVARSRCKHYTIKLTAGAQYQIDMVTQTPGFDPFLRLEDETGRQLAADDDGGGFPNARIIIRPTHSGTYRVIATAFAGTLGRYRLTVRK
jgi:hypothetical protein